MPNLPISDSRITSKVSLIPPRHLYRVNNVPPRLDSRNYLTLRSGLTRTRSYSLCLPPSPRTTYDEETDEDFDTDSDSTSDDETTATMGPADRRKRKSEKKKAAARRRETRAANAPAQSPRSGLDSDIGSTSESEDDDDSEEEEGEVEGVQGYNQEELDELRRKGFRKVTVEEVQAMARGVGGKGQGRGGRGKWVRGPVSWAEMSGRPKGKWVGKCLGGYDGGLMMLQQRR